MARSNLSEMLAFLAVVEAGSFVGGGKKLGLSRSATGKAVSRLEDRLGARLVNRTTRKLSLTDDGRIFLGYCRQVTDAIDIAEASVSGSSGTPAGTVRVSVPTAFGRQYVLPALYDYMNAWPKVNVEVNFTDRLVDLIEEGIDLTLRIGMQTTDPAQDTLLISRVVSRHKAVVCAAGNYLDRRGHPATPEDLERHDCIRFVSSLRRHVWRLREPEGGWIRVNARGRLCLDEGQAIVDAAVAGKGVAYLPDFLVAAHIRSGALVPVLREYEAEDVPIVATYPSKKLLPPKTRFLIDHLARRLATGKP